MWTTISQKAKSVSDPETIQRHKCEEEGREFWPPQMYCLLQLNSKFDNEV